MTTAETRSKPKLKSLKCTQCGGSVSINGGHKVQSIVCQYCGTCMDAKNDFKALYQFTNRRKPLSPLKIGKKGKLKDIDFIVIGMLEYEQRDDGEIYKWIEYLLFSKTHGYVWLCYEEGHWCLIHEVKDLPDQQVSIHMPRKSTFTVRNKTFKTFECAKAKVSYVEGELTWVAKQSETISYQDAICPPFLYSIEKRGSEQEYFWGEYLPYKEVEKAFQIDLNAPVGIYSCQPSSVPPVIDGIGKAAILTTILSFVIYFIISTSGSLMFKQKLGAAVFKDGSKSKVFKVHKPNELFGITLDVPSLNNEWAYYDFKVTDKKGDMTYFSMPTSVSYYHGYDDGSWSEGSKDIANYFRLPEKGEYVFSIEGEGGSGNTPNKGFNRTANIQLYRGAVMGHRTLLWFFLCLVISGIYLFVVFSFETRRWSDGDEEDD